MSKLTISVVTALLAAIALAIIICLHNSQYQAVSEEYGILMDAGSSHTGIFLYKWTPKQLIPRKNAIESKSINSSSPSPSTSSSTSIVASMPDKIEQIAKCEVHSGIAGLNVDKVHHYFEKCIATLGKKLSHIFDNENIEISINNSLLVNSNSSNDTTLDDVVANSNNQSKMLIPLYLEATAGMRLLNLTSSSRAENLFTRVKEYLSSIDYLDPREVRIIPGTLEGFYSWLTVNYLTDTLKNNEATYAIIECGGASTQIAHEVDPIKIRSAISQNKLSDDDYHQVTLYGNDKNIRSTSYLCYGKDQFNLRLHQMLILSKFDQDPSIYSHNTIAIDNPCMNTGLREMKDVRIFLDAPCLKLSSDQSLNMSSFKNKTQFFFKGTSKPEECSKLISNIIDEATCKKTFNHCVTNHNLLDSTEKIYAISAFYHAAVAVSDRESFQGKVTREQFIEKTDELCHKNWNEIKNEKNRFMQTQCFSSLLVRAMIEDMYHIKDWSKIQFVKKVKGDTIGWTLGSMVNKARTIEIKYKTVQMLQSTAFYTFATVASITLIGATLCTIWSLYDRREKK